MTALANPYSVADTPPRTASRAAAAVILATAATATVAPTASGAYAPYPTNEVDLNYNFNVPLGFTGGTKLVPVNRPAPDDTSGRTEWGNEYSPEESVQAHLQALRDGVTTGDRSTIDLLRQSRGVYRVVNEGNSAEGGRIAIATRDGLHVFDRLDRPADGI